MGCSIYQPDDSKGQEVSQWNPQSYLLWFFPDAGLTNVSLSILLLVVKRCRLHSGRFRGAIIPLRSDDTVKYDRLPY